MFDLDAYLVRIGLPARVTSDSEGLGRLQREHRLSIPFENLDVRLGRGIAIDSDSVFAKLVTAKRGGYCFEQNRLFMDALAALGFQVRPLLARVRLGATETPPLTHTLSLVTIDGREWIADAGFGGSYAPVMALVDGWQAEASDGAAFRLDRDADHGWLLSRRGDPGSTDGRRAGDGGADGWQPQYSFHTTEVFDADLALSNHWTSTAPASRFTQVTIASIVLPHGLAALTDRHYHRRAGDNTTRADITDPRVYRMRMSLMFGIDLTPEDVAALGLF
ncbi:N-hydroxyarylamine O-acetyltransferase [Sphingomonas insulae]|uniref:Arylamine N-acetyltransferase n=1 Tax=Sphingomonas insulae TaxID=424800 RepID=A0ABN1HKU1_9SPHN|nr:arylamine N-acetyltransferase [Sphingomonas insulae]NIJ30353.1 N-hydroxyarylamine O-acetyltransferase [Sphingomonas insulae]